MTNPIWLPCTDAFCKACLPGFETADNPAGKVECPLCEKQCDWPTDNVQQRRNKFILKLVETRNEQVSAERHCELCEGVPDIRRKRKRKRAEYFCKEDGQSLCAECHCKHKICPTTSEHTIYLLDAALQKSRQEIAEVLEPLKKRTSTLATLDETDKTAIEKISAEKERALRAVCVLRRKIQKMEQEIKAINDKQREHSADFRTRRRLVKFAEELQVRGNFSEQLCNWEPLKEELMTLKEVDDGLPKLDFTPAGRQEKGTN